MCTEYMDTQVLWPSYHLKRLLSDTIARKVYGLTNCRFILSLIIQSLQLPPIDILYTAYENFNLWLDKTF